MPRKKKTTNKGWFQTGIGNSMLIKKQKKSVDNAENPKKPQTRSKSKKEAEAYKYAIFSIDELEHFMNESCIDHRLKNPDCYGYIKLKKNLQRVISTTWSMYCSKCSFQSKSYNMYKTKAGTKKSTLNEALGIALVRSPIGPSVFSEIMLCLGVDPGSLKGLNNLVAGASQICNDVCEKHLSDVRAKFSGHSIPLEADSRYNNPIGSRETHFQGGTQSVLTVCENVTQRKEIIDFVVQNKLCVGCTRYRNRGINVAVGGHPNCTATLELSHSIGAEGLSATQSGKKLKDAKIDVGHVTTDGDSKIGNSLKKEFPGAKVLQCSIHYARLHKKAICNAAFSPLMFDEKTKAARKTALKWFAQDLSERCSAELKLAVKSVSTLKSDEQIKQKLNTILKKTPDAIIDCYRGKCGRMCQKYSMACNGSKSKFVWKKKSMLKNKAITMTKDDEITMRELILRRLGEEAIGKTYLNSNTNKVEALHRAYSKSNPKNVTCPKTFKGRISASVLNLNLGFEETTCRLLTAVGHTTSAEVQKKIHQHSKNIDYLHEYKKAKKSTDKRIAKRNHNDDEWRNKNNLQTDKSESRDTYIKATIPNLRKRKGSESE